MFTRFRQKRGDVRTIAMMLDHDGRNWVLSGQNLHLTAASLEDIDRELEQALKPQLEKETRIEVLMTSNNEMIPEWMRPYMNHYFNRRLELPLRY